MRKVFKMALIGLTAVLTSGRLPAQETPNFSSRLVATDTEAYGILPPEMVAGPMVTEASVSPTGRFVLAVRLRAQLRLDDIKRGQMSPTLGERSLVLWDRQEHTSRTVWKRRSQDATISNIVWLPKTETAFAIQIETPEAIPSDPNRPPHIRESILKIAPDSETATVINPAPNDGSVSYLLFASPTAPILAAQTIPTNAPDSRSVVFLLDAAGHVMAHSLASDNGTIERVNWDSAGMPLVQIAPRGKRQPDNVGWYAMNVRTGELKPAELATENGASFPRFYKLPAPTAGPLRVRQTSANVKEAESRETIGLVWLESAVKSVKPRALVTSDGSDAQLLPGGDTVLYRSQGALWAAPLLHLSLAEFVTIKRAADRAVMLNRAKQAALAALMYAQDNDEAFPAGADWSSKLAPYLQDGNILDGFNFLIGGTKLADIGSPATTEMGFYDGEGGRVVVYADGHVKWRNTP